MYCSVDDIREYDTSITEASYPNASVTASIEMAVRVIDKETRQWFEPRDAIFTLTGNGINDLVFPVPAIEITSVSIDGEEIDSDNYKIFKSGTQVNRFLRNTYDVWPRDSEIEITGRFGLVEPITESVPPEAKRLCMILTVMLLKKQNDELSYKSERFKDHSYEMADGQELFWGNSEAWRLLDYLRAPVLPEVI